MVLIFVEYLWQTSLSFDIDLSEVVGTLKAQIKAQIQEITGKPITQQCLQHLDDDSMCQLRSQYNSPELQDEKALEFYGISEGTILFSSPSPHAAVTIFVKTLAGKTLTCAVRLDWDVLMLKRIIQDKERTPLAPHCSWQGLGRHINAFVLWNEDTIHLVERLRGGGAWKALAEANPTKFSDDYGLKLIRGKVVVISEMVDENWYGGFVPGVRYDRPLVFPSSYVRIKRFLDSDFQAAAPGYFRAKGGILLPSEKADAESILTDILPDGGEPAPPLHPFNYKTAPSSFKCNIADAGSSFVSVTFTPNQRVIPGDTVRVNVKLLCLAHDPRLRIASVSLRAIVPGNEVRSVEPQKLIISEGVMVVHRSDKANKGKAAELKLKPARGEIRRTDETIIERSEEVAISCDFRGDVDRNTAVWSIKANGAQGIRGNVEQLSFTLGRQPRDILYTCSVSAMMDGESIPITRHVRSGASRWIRNGQLPFFQQFK